MITQTLLQGKRVTLEPLEDINYLLDLADKDNKGFCTRDQVKEMLDTNGGDFWLITLNGSKWGVVGYFIVNDIYILEALKDHSVEPTGIGYSVEVGNLVLDYMFNLTDKVRTVAKVEDKSIQLLCKKLGFNQLYIENNLIVYEKER